MDDDAKRVSPFEQAAQDAILYGAGWLVIRPNGEIEHIPPEKYLKAADDLAWAYDDIRRGLPKK